MDGIRFPLEITGRRQLATTSSQKERVASDLYVFLSAGRGSNPFLARDGLATDSPVYLPQSERDWAKVKQQIRQFFDLMAAQRRARLVTTEVEHDGSSGETTINVQFISIEDGQLETTRYTP